MSIQTITDHMTANYYGLDVVNKFGRNLNISGNSTAEIIWSGGATYAFQSIAQNIELISTSNNDIVSGTGARSVQVFGYDENWNEINEIKNTNGTNAVPLTNKYIRIYRVKVLEVGNSETNEGIITIRLAGGGVTQAVIEVGAGQTLMAIYSIGAGKKGYLRIIDMHCIRVNTTVRVAGQLIVREFGKSKQIKKTFSLTDSNNFIRDFYGSIQIPEKSDIWLEKTFASASCEVSGSFDLRVV